MISLDILKQTCLLNWKLACVNMHPLVGSCCFIIVGNLRWLYEDSQMFCFRCFFFFFFIGIVTAQDLKLILFITHFFSISVDVQHVYHFPAQNRNYLKYHSHTLEPGKQMNFNDITWFSSILVFLPFTQPPTDSHPTHQYSINID